MSGMGLAPDMTATSCGIYYKTDDKFFGSGRVTVNRINMLSFITAFGHSIINQ